MKTLVLSVMMLLAVLNASAENGDVLTLKTNQSFKGEIIKIKKTTLLFKAIDGMEYIIPANDVSNIFFEDANGKYKKSYERLLLAQENACMKGASDGKAFHGKGGLHVALGVLFGPFAVIGAAVGSPDPMGGARTTQMSKNSDLFSDPQYLECYKKAARGKNVGMAAAGWGMWILLLLI